MKKDNVIIAFNYLMTEYNCLLNFEDNRGNHYNFQNKTFKLKKLCTGII